MSLKVKVEGQVIELPEDFKKAMEYFSNADAIQKLQTGQPVQIDGTIMTKNTFLDLKKACEVCMFSFPKINNRTIKTNDVRETIGGPLSDFLADKNFKQLNALFKGAKFLQMEDLAKCISAKVVTVVYYKPTLQGYRSKKEQLKIDKDMTSEFSKKLKEDYNFMN